MMLLIPRGGREQVAYKSVTTSTLGAAAFPKKSRCPLSAYLSGTDGQICRTFNTRRDFRKIM